MSISNTHKTICVLCNSPVKTNITSRSYVAVCEGDGIHNYFLAENGGYNANVSLGKTGSYIKLLVDEDGKVKEFCRLERYLHEEDFDFGSLEDSINYLKNLLIMQ